MNNYIKSSPDGVKDLLFNECKLRRDIENKLESVFRLRGYHEVITPVLEYYDIFSFANSYMPLETMYKLTDLSGRLIVLRPDITVPIGRIITTHLKDALPPIRLSYNQNVFRMSRNLSGQKNEIAQSGVELIGTNGIKPDLEIIMCAVEALKALQSFSGSGFRFEIGHVDFVKVLINRLPLSPGERTEISELLRIKNYARLNDALNKYKHLPAAKGLMRLPSLFGGAEVLKAAKEFSEDELMLETIGYLEEIYGYMLKLGLCDDVMIDLGLVPGNVYYTGIVFRGYMDGLGSPVLSGGRYDNLFKEFGRDLPATGFAIYVDEAIKTAVRANQGNGMKSYILHAESGYEMDAYKYSEELREKGIPCIVSTFDNKEQTIEYAKKLKTDNLAVVGKEIKFIIKDGQYETD